jgi:hypothetical protein
MVSATIAGSNLTRCVSGDVSAPAARNASRASASRKSMPSSDSTRSDAWWIDSISSADRTSVGR